MRKKKTIYEISNRNGTVWAVCKTGTVLASRWLEYTMKDGTHGIMRPKTWRVKEDKKNEH